MNRPLVLGTIVATLLVAIVVTWIDVRQQREFRRLINAGDAAAAREQPVAAIEAFSGAIALKRDAMLPYLKRGDAYRQRGEWQAAFRDLSHAAALDPTAPRAVELLGDVSAAMGQHQRASEYFGRYLSLDDRAPRVLYKLAVAQYRLSQYDAAIEGLQKATALDPRFAAAEYLLGMCLRAERRIDQAIGAYARAIAIEPALAAAHEELAEIYAWEGRRRDELEQLEALAALEPGRPERLVAVGLAYERTGRPDAALVTLARAADRYRDAPIVNTAVGRVWLDVAETHHDAAALRHALAALQPPALSTAASSDTLTLYGRALLLDGDVRGAERVLQQATLRPPLDATAFERLSVAATRLHHTDIARRAATQYAALRP
jgi:tetratricopeptide (TPR) repeat protein